MLRPGQKVSTTPPLILFLCNHVGRERSFGKEQNEDNWLAEVRNFCERCHQCQKTTPYKLALTPPEPIIEVPFEQVGMNLVGTLLKCAHVHKYILVIVKHYPNPPQKARYMFSWTW